jgi:hypothetical protein
MMKKPAGAEAAGFLLCRFSETKEGLTCPILERTPLASIQVMGSYAVGDVLCDEYVVRLPLERGGMGEVYLVEHATSGELRAAKVMHVRGDATLPISLASVKKRSRC